MSERDKIQTISGIEFKRPNVRVLCRDGHFVSVQASDSAYCTPRDNHGPYTHVEAGLPSCPPPESWFPYAEDESERAIYAYMPIELVDEFIREHGGMVAGELPERA